MALITVNMLWVGGLLGPIERLSLASFVAQGHPVRLHAYDAVGDVPPGVEVSDAARVVPLGTVMANRYRNGSFALASNLFRYRLMQLGDGLWADIDVVALKPIAIDKPVIVGWETTDYLNGAVLYFRRDLPLADEAVAAFRPGFLPPWLSWRKRTWARLRRLAGQPLTPATLPHGSFGPKAVTALVRKHGLIALAEPREVFYPLPPRMARAAFTAGVRLTDVATDRSLTVHLWNEKIRDLRNTRPEPGSLVAELYARYGM